MEDEGVSSRATLNNKAAAVNRLKGYADAVAHLLHLPSHHASPEVS